jgi:hypothetical protein
MCLDIDKEKHQSVHILYRKKKTLQNSYIKTNLIVKQNLYSNITQ